ncbi:MAG: hypothetical protein LC135_12395 [Phycisphaerae bacterium]|nr:hypothetical protein [Phycisphaerae bacterium]MCZ2400651.1 hypothetical protein [Phycisphaerae bacterium]NUQ49507.1 hypothetical protein [Phycisphaerae bacterium]
MMRTRELERSELSRLHLTPFRFEESEGEEEGAIPDAGEGESSPFDVQEDEEGMHAGELVAGARRFDDEEEGGDDDVDFDELDDDEEVDDEDEDLDDEEFDDDEDDDDLDELDEEDDD